MVYRKYGEAFRELRRQHSMALADFEKLGISIGTLSNFENGKSMIAFDKLDIALQEMHTSLLDYSLIINNGAADYFIEEFSKMSKAYYCHDVQTLQKIYEKNLNYGKEDSWFIAISAKSCYTNLDRTEVNRLITYFKNIKSWEIFELSIFVNTLKDLPLDFVTETIDKIWEVTRYYSVITDYRLLIIRIILRSALLVIDHHDERTANYLIERGRSLLFPTDATNRIMLNFAEGYRLYTFHDTKKGRQLMNQTLRVFSLIGAEELKETFTRHYEKRIRR